MNHGNIFMIVFGCLCLHNLKLSSCTLRLDVPRLEFLGHIVSLEGAQPNDGWYVSLTRTTMLTPMPTDNKQYNFLSPSVTLGTSTNSPRL